MSRLHKRNQPAPARHLPGDGGVRAFIELSAIPTFILTADAGFIHANPAFARHLGYQAPPRGGFAVADFVHAEDAGALAAQAARCASGDAGAPAEFRFLAKNGDVLWMRACAVPLQDAAPGAGFAVIQLTDISDLKRAASALAAIESRWNFALESLGQGFWDRDLITQTEQHSPAWKAMRGFKPDDEVRAGFNHRLARVHPDDQLRLFRELDDLGTGKCNASTGEYQELHSDGHWMRIVSRRRTVEWTAKGEPARIIGIDADVTDIRNAEEKLQFANTLLRTEMDASPDGILVVDASARIISYNQRFAAMWSIPIGMLTRQDDEPVLMAVTSAIKNPGEFVARVRYLYDHPEEESHDELETTDGRSIDRHTEVLRTPAGAYLGRVWFFRDITQRKKAEAQILRLARSDNLTGLANRLVFTEAIERAIAAVRGGAETFAVLYLDLDHFKDVNDTLGHPVGDDFLIAVSGRLRASIRAGDLVARFGGDEFAVIVSGIQEARHAAGVAETLIAAMRAPFIIHGCDIRSSVSIGIALFGADEPSVEAMLSRADIALYSAKAEGGSSYRFHTGAMDSEIKTRVTLSAELREGIDRGQLVLLYQPQVDLASRRIIGVEALVRWRHPTRGVLTPGVFIPIAERSGLISSLGHWVLREACRQAKAWLDAGIAPEVMAVNLSGVQFKRAFELEREIAAVLAETGMPANRLEFELTETVLMAASGEHNEFLGRLRRGGIRLAIDDFGVGYSSLDYLRRFPVDRIKIAGDFVAQVATEAGSAAIVKATIGLARELGIRVIAEGIETPAQLELLRAWGCLEGQGYYFAEPLNGEALAPLLRSGCLRVGEEMAAR